MRKLIKTATYIWKHVRKQGDYRAYWQRGEGSVMGKYAGWFWCPIDANPLETDPFLEFLFFAAITLPPKGERSFDTLALPYDGTMNYGICIWWISVYATVPRWE